MRSLPEWLRNVITVVVMGVVIASFFYDGIPLWPVMLLLVALTIFDRRRETAHLSRTVTFLAHADGEPRRQLRLIHHGPRSSLARRPNVAGWDLRIAEIAADGAEHVTHEHWSPDFAEIVAHTALAGDTPLVWRREGSDEPVDLTAAAAALEAQP